MKVEIEWKRGLKWNCVGSMVEAKWKLMEIQWKEVALISHHSLKR